MEDDMKRELNALKNAVAGMETRLGGVETRLGGVETRIGGVENRLDRAEAESGEMKGMLRRLVVAVTKLVADVADIRGTLAAKMATKQDLGRLQKQMDSAVFEIEASRRERIIFSDAYMLHQRRLDDHERRVARLEARRA